ncbi:MAG: nucleotidyltransferase domain-containing protein [Bacteroidaceae bacterium]|nr:nucleotidyltransferase domain-containing protein [Bacteroidaceae bacterium]
MPVLVDIKKLRKTRRFTQTQLGLLCGMNKSQISRMEKGTLGSPETVSRVLNALGYEIKYEVVDRFSNLKSETEIILDILKHFKETNAQKYGIIKLGLFGSYARGEQTPSSDIDICLLMEEPSLFKVAGIHYELKSIFKKEIDLLLLSESLQKDLINELKKDTIYV